MFAAQIASLCGGYPLAAKISRIAIVENLDLELKLSRIETPSVTTRASG
jgi:hypothetical protein